MKVGRRVKTFKIHFFFVRVCTTIFKRYNHFKCLTCLNWSTISVKNTFCNMIYEAVLVSKQRCQMYWSHSLLYWPQVRTGICGARGAGCRACVTCGSCADACRRGGRRTAGTTWCTSSRSSTTTATRARGASDRLSPACFCLLCVFHWFCEC